MSLMSLTKTDLQAIDKLLTRRIKENNAAIGEVIDKAVNRLDKRIDKLAVRIDGLEDTMERRFDKLDDRLTFKKPDIIM